MDYHVYTFRQEKQKSGENITEFYTRLQLLACKCQFADPELEIKRQIIQGTSSLRLRRKAIEQSLNLENLLKVARTMETADDQTTQMEKQQSNAVGYGRNKATDVQQKETVVANPIIGTNLRIQRNRLKVNTMPGLQMLKSLRVVKCHL